MSRPRACIYKGSMSRRSSARSMRGARRWCTSAPALTSETWPSRIDGRERCTAQPPGGEDARTQPLLEIAAARPLPPVWSVLLKRERAARRWPRCRSGAEQRPAGTAPLRPRGQSGLARIQLAPAPPSAEKQGPRTDRWRRLAPPTRPVAQLATRRSGGRGSAGPALVMACVREPRPGSIGSRTMTSRVAG